MTRIGKDDDLMTRLLHLLKGEGLDSEALRKVEEMLSPGAEDGMEDMDPKRHGGDDLGPRRELGSRRELGPRDANDALAMDAAPGSAAGHVARDLAIERTAPFVGRHVVLAQDSAENVYRAALTELGVPNARGIHRHALMVTFDATVRQQRSAGPATDLRHGGVPRPVPTMAEVSSFARRFPNLGNVRSLG